MRGPFGERYDADRNDHAEGAGPKDLIGAASEDRKDGSAQRSPKSHAEE